MVQKVIKGVGARVREYLRPFACCLSRHTPAGASPNNRFGGFEVSRSRHLPPSLLAHPSRPLRTRVRNEKEPTPATPTITREMDPGVVRSPTSVLPLFPCCYPSLLLLFCSLSPILESKRYSDNLVERVRLRLLTKTGGGPDGREREMGRSRG